VNLQGCIKKAVILVGQAFQRSTVQKDELRDLRFQCFRFSQK